MKLRYLTKLLTIILLIVSITSCQQNSAKFELKGKLSGITDGKIILTLCSEDESQKSDTVLIKKGEFIFTGNISEPTQCVIKVEGKEHGAYFYAENAKMTMTGDADTLYKAIITGGIVNESEKSFQTDLDKLVKSIKDKFKADSLLKVYAATKDEGTKKLIDVYSAEFRIAYDKYQLGYIKQNPASYYSAILIEQSAFGKSAANIEDDLLMLDPKLNDTKIVKG